MSDLVSYIKEANHTFVTDHAASGITELSKYPARKLAVLACMDARLLYLLEPALGLKRGDANIIKVAGNTAGRGFDSVIGSLMVAVYELHVEDILVIGHDDCGMLHTTSASLCEKMAAAGIPAAVIEELEPRLMAWADPVCDSEESVRVAVRQLQKNPYLPDTVRFHGAVIRPDTGDVRFIVENAEKK
ncbi:beta-class carbonic anhydrase [Megasphaera hominis]|uniref:carbonic anhydrase n=1 Tax=Megasphaera hominis TaxID=159836 RepID=A0ABR6VJK0_9FIRM|nr:carbonic anhydrase [uncultured Megasphaera sp.]MBC3537447.1 carbonic anhydrase [Megasphaera hominis]